MILLCTMQHEIESTVDEAHSNLRALNVKLREQFDGTDLSMSIQVEMAERQKHRKCKQVAHNVHNQLVSGGFDHLQTMSLQ